MRIKRDITTIDLMLLLERVLDLDTRENSIDYCIFEQLKNCVIVNPQTDLLGLATFLEAISLNMKIGKDSQELKDRICKDDLFHSEQIALRYWGVDTKNTPNRIGTLISIRAIELCGEIQNYLGELDTNKG